ncbi:MAG: GNAT family N-acetyltransferase [Candidatus Omnitrophota bacterium]|nr:GNAT family N-acetyltransferase [Candidatus Omnitrophota bacterium]
MDVCIHESVKDVDESKWDVIVGRNRLICRHKYIRAVEDSQINDCRYFYPVVYDGEDIIAHTSVYFISTELDLFAQGATKKIIHSIRKKRKDFCILRSLECGTPIALGNTISFKEGIDQRKVFTMLYEKIESLAKEMKVKVLLFRDFNEEETPFYDILKDLEYVKIHNLPNTKIDIKWKTFDEYLSAMRSQYRWKIVNRMKDFYKDDVFMEIVNEFSQYSGELERLCRNVYDQAKEYKRERLPAVFFENMDKYLGERSAIILAKKGKIPIGFTLLFFDDDILIPIFSGLDYNYNYDYSVYFNLLYKSVDVAIQNSMKCVELGITTLVPKKEIGAEVVPLNMYMKHFNSFLNRIVPKAFDLMTPQDKTKVVRVFKKAV